MIYLFPVIATHRDGDTVLLYSVAEIISFVKGKFVGTEWFRDKPLYTWTRDPDYNDWILRDDRGRPVDHREFIPSSSDWRRRARKRRGNFNFRDGPVPGCGGWHKCTKFRAPRKAHGGVRAHRVLPDILDKEFKGRKLTVRYFD